MIHEGTLEFRRELRIDRDAAEGSIRVVSAVSDQGCDLRSCEPPTKVKLEATPVITDRSEAAR
jgi:hypothetical protein